MLVCVCFVLCCCVISEISFTCLYAIFRSAPIHCDVTCFEHSQRIETRTIACSWSVAEGPNRFVTGPDAQFGCVCVCAALLLHARISGWPN